MSDSKFAEHWAQAQFCYFRAEAAKSPVIKHLWIQLAQDWIALSEGSMNQTEPENELQPMQQRDPLERMEPFLVA